jgi:hypothetical protein
MPRHSDFQKIYDAFMWRYCKDKKECEEGKRVYYAWLNKLGLDDTKPYQKPQEKFSWIKPYINFLKEDEKAKYFKVEALFPLSSMNDNVYTKDELLQAARSLVGKTVDLNHTDEKLPEVTIYDAQYEDNCVECLLRVAKESKALQMIENDEILQVSIEADCLRGTEQTPEGNVCHGLVFTGLALLTKDVLPGVPLTRIMPVEKLVESFTVTSVTNLNEPNSQNQAPGQNPAPPPPATPPTVSPEGFGDASFPDDCFAYVPDSAKGVDGNKSDRKLPYKNKDGTVDLDHARNALARLDQTQGIPDAEKEKIRTMLQNILKKANPDYTPPESTQQQKEDLAYDALRAEIEDNRNKTAQEIQAIKDQISQLKQATPEKKTEAEPCKCVLTKEGFWARFHQLRSKGLDKSDAFRIVSQEVIEVVAKKSQ